MNDLSEAFQVDEAIKHMTPEKQEAVRAAASAITGEPQESTERAAALLISEFEQAQEHPTIESAFNEIEQEAQKVLLQPEAPEGSNNTSVLDAVQQATIVILDQLTDFINSGKLDEARAEFQVFKQALEKLENNLRQSVENSQADIERWRQELAEAQALSPYISMAIAEHPEYQSLTISEFLEARKDEQGNAVPSRYEEIIERARILQQSLDSHESENLLRYSYKPIKQYKTDTDKLVNMFFSITAPAGVNLDGQREIIPVYYGEGKAGKKKEQLLLFYDFTYNDKELSEKGIPQGFDSYDYFVACALDNLYANENQFTSCSKILECMGYTGRPSSEDIESLERSLVKGMSTIIHINDRAVQSAYGNSRFHDIRSPVFPIQTLTQRAIASGFITDMTIKINGFTPFHDVAAMLNHTTVWDMRVLQLYSGRRTKRYWSVLHFLIREIGWMRNEKSKRSHKILYETLYRRTGAKTIRDKDLTRSMLYRILDDSFKPTGYVKSYKESGTTTPGVILTLGNPTLLLE